MASSSYSDQSKAKYFMELMAFGAAHAKTESPIPTFSITRVINPSNPVTFHLRDSFTGEIAEGYFQPLKKKYKPDLIIPPVEICTCTCSKEKTLAHMDDFFIPLAKKSLAYYNDKENTNLSFVKVTGGNYGCDRRNKVHINFIATSEDGTEKLLFSELADGSVRHFISDHIDEFNVKGCCLLYKIESGNPIGWGCDMCCKGAVIHPGPEDGYLVVGGDLFEDYPFWGYRSPPTTSNATHDEKEIYFACAMKAVEYFNSKQSTDFMAVEVIGSSHYPCIHKKIVHVNFKCITSTERKQQLFFAELVIPNFTDDCGKWDDRKGPFVVVKGCCLLEKVGPGNPFGRHCEDCYCTEVIHPGPKDGYRVRVGDNFQDYGFMNIGLGIY